MTLTTIDQITPGGYFAVKSASAGHVAFKKLVPGEADHTRLHDGIFLDPTFGPGSVVRSLTRDEALTMAEANRQP